MKILFTLTLLAFSFMSIAQKSFSGRAIESSKAWIDLDYVGDGIIGHKLDIFLPNEGKGPFPVIVTIYGSAWFSNSSKGNCFQDGFGQRLLAAGYAVVSINHRSSKDALWPAQIHDVKAAIRFIRANAADFSLDTNFIGITGFSSGGHLSAMAGVSSRIKTYSKDGLSIDLEGSVGKFTDAESHVDAVVNWYGPTDFLIMDTCGSEFSHDAPESPESSLIGGPIQENKEKVMLANPLTYASNDNPPMLIFHGDKDPLVPLCESQKLYEKQMETGASSQLVIVPGGGHGPGVMIPEYFEQMVAFFDKLRSK